MEFIYLPQAPQIPLSELARIMLLPVNSVWLLAEMSWSPNLDARLRARSWYAPWKRLCRRTKQGLRACGVDYFNRRNMVRIPRG